MATSRGRPRSTEIDDAVRAAAAESLDRDGYAGVVIEDVARRAGVSKTAVYRRWPNRRELTLAVLQDRLGRIETPETGCTLCDVHEALVLVTEATCSLGAGTLAQLIAEGVDEALSEVALEPPRRAVHRLLFAARGRGDLRADVDLRLATDSLISLVFYRLLLGEDPMNAEEIETVVIAVLRGLAADPAELLREYTTHTAHTEHQP